MKVFSLALVSALLVGSSTALEGSYSDASLCCYTNYYRKKANLPMFKFSAKLSKVASAHAIEMAAQGEWTHDGLTASTKTLMNRVEKEGDFGEWNVALENVADTYTTMFDVSDGWYHHEEHKVNMLREGSHITCGSGHYYDQGQDKDFWVQNMLTYDTSDMADSVDIDCSSIFSSLGLEESTPSSTPTPSPTPVQAKARIAPSGSVGVEEPSSVEEEATPEASEAGESSTPAPPVRKCKRKCTKVKCQKKCKRYRTSIFA
ncbi:hypothetical protein H4R34_001878 [Dimargaris verticillata]|uniref:SCP domain-containing protein n=1 Tax=Dimargaris verticillata TaxID=2761393 RepID=A0A9W8B3U3_9FUNG|nr:hypothetical protein H4R34_001878 [Dimargaris verticillata]